ncbi:otogelin [Electrophorus electricus]|uniref:otogelin n=1 Tax=Electrophorus electricus TaxID=8005 RepID=UPI0015CFAFC3|nr:otogelin [Electrophorus electricus]
MDPNLNLIQKIFPYFLLFCFGLIHQVPISWGTERVNLTNQHGLENESSRIMLAKWDPGSQAEQQILLSNTSEHSESEWAGRRAMVHNSPCTFPCLNGGQCLSENTCNCSIYQATGSRCQTVPNSGLEREMTCRSWGQYNYETFDGLYYYFPGKCSYTLLKDCEDNTQSSVLIQVHNDPECGFRPYSCTRSVSLFLPWEGEIRLQNYNVSFKGQSVQLPHNIHDIELERIADYILVSQAQGFMLAWQGLSSSIYIKMSPEFVGRTCGLCGNFNADIQDDLKTSYGMLTEDIAIFGNSWMEEEPQGPTCPTIPSFYPSPCSTQDPHILMKVEEVCASLLKEPFKSCHQFVSPYSYMASCSNDLCLSGPNGEVVCQVFMEYARVCAHAGHPLHNWRARFPVCGIECPLGLHYRECITCCPVHCSVEWMCIDNKLQCLDGCYCPDDLIYDDGMCVKSSDCPCEHRGMLYPSGHTIQDECNNCTCVGGLWNCTKHSCPGECSVTGDMYFQSFDGHVYTFLATCQYVLAKSRNSGGFIVTIQNAPCGPNLDGACIQSVNLILNDDPRTEVTLSHSGEVYMTSQFHITLPHSDEVFQIQELSSMFVQVKTSQGLLLQYNWREFRLYLQLGELWRDDTVGLCGTFNGNIQDDFLAPSGMIESTPHLFGNAWRVSSACVPRPSLPQLDPCDTHQQAASYAVEKCELLMQEVFAVCHEYVSPMVFQLQCRADVCRCGTPCLCSALAHYTRACRKHNVIIEFRLHVPECSVTCPPTMEYGVCVSSCQRHCLSLSVPQLCGEECEEGCVCPQGTYYSTHTHACVKRSECPCSFLGAEYSPGDVILTSSSVQICQDGKLILQTIITDKLCPPGQVYEDCGNRLEGPSTSKGLACLPTCESYLLNLTCSIHEPCVPGCVCPAGLLKHVDECFEPIACPCLWKGKEYYPGDRVSSPCHQCVCQHGSFQCEFRPCASMCTLYGDRHYRTFDGLIFDYIGACKVYLLKTSADVMISVTAKNVDCFENGVICRKSIVISVGQSFIIFDDESGKPNPASMIERQNVYIWNAGYFTFIHLLQYELSLLWDRKTTIHIQAGPRWQGKLSGLCGNFDLKTVNDMRTPDNMDLLTAQEFGNSWTAAECVNSPDIRHPCTLNPLREPFAKRQCGILLSEVFQVCHPVVDVTWFYMNCLADTCGCSRGGDCECFCTSVAVYAHRCCHHGITIDWRTPSLCPYDCEYYNKVIGKGPLRLLTHRDRNLLLAANQTNGMVFLKRGMESTDGVLTRFMMTPGLSKTRPHDPSLVSFEAADRPNYFLHTERSGRLRLHKWEDSKAFWDAATFILHRNTWISGFDSLESLVWPGFFLHYMLSRLQLLKYNHSDRYRRATLFKLAGSTTDYSMGPLCQWRYESCVSPCFRTCSDPAARSCIDILKVEGCVAQCPVHMVLDEVTQKCVYVEDCINPPVTPPGLITTSTVVTSEPLDTEISTSSRPATESITSTTQMMSPSPKPSSTASTTATTGGLILSPTPSTAPIMAVLETTVTTVKTSVSSAKPLSSTLRTTRSPDMSSLSPITVRTQTVSTSISSPVTSATLRSAGTLALSTVTSSPVVSSVSPMSAEQPTRISTLLFLPKSTPRDTTESTSLTLKESLLDTASTEPATVSKLSNATARPTVISTASAKTFSAETSSIYGVPPLELNTSATITQPTVSPPIHILTVTTPVFTPSTEFNTTVSAFRTLKSTPVSGTETREYSVAHTTGTTKPTSSAVMKTSTTHLPVKPETSPLTQTTHSLLTITTPEQLETSKTTLPVIPDIDQQATQIISGPSTVSTIKAVETILTTTDQPTLIPRSIHTPWSPAVPVSEKILHTTTSWGLSQTATTRFTSTQSVPPELFQTTIKVAEPTDTSTAVPLLTTHTTVFPSPIEHITSVLTPSQVLPTHVTTPRTSPMVITGTTSKATTASSTESHVSPFPESSSATAHLRESVITSTQLSTSHPTIAAKIMTKETLPSYTPGSPKVTITTSATTLVPQKQPTVSTSMMSTAAATEKPHPTLSTTGSKTSTLSSAILHLKTETTHYPPHTDRAALSTTKATQPSSWSPALYMSSTSPPELTSPSERMTTILTSTISVSTTQGTPRITKTTSISPSLVTEKAATSTFVSLEMTEPVSQTSLFSTIPSTKAYPQTPEHASETKTTAILMSTVTATDSPLAPSNYTTTSSKTTTSPTTSSSSASPVVTERPPAPDISPEVSSVVPATPTSPSVTESKHWMTPEEETSLTKTASSTTTEGVVSPKVCMPPYSEVVDECTKLICVSGQLLLFNKSQSCPYDSSPPNCGLLGFAVQVNGDKCCPKWTCPCRCSVFPDLNVVTFDGNNVAIFKAASYVVTRLPNETISILVQECHSTDSTVIWNFTHLCLTALNITHEANEVLINRIQRHLYVNSRYAKPRFKKYGFEVLDTGNMYLIRSPAGLKIQWFHSTGMMVIETDTCTNKLSTMGLCGCCDGNPLNDLTLSNGTVVAETEDPAVFIDSWQVPNTTSYVSHSRRREVNCSTSDCSTCHSMLNNPSFTACRPYVPPATFCEVWVRDAEYVNNPCVALAAYVASCNRFNICIEWRSPHYCPFMCPENLQYQACLSACTAVSCPNQDFEYHVEQCSGLSEGCECPQGTLLHRPYSTLCIPPQKCACTDSFGAPRTLGEVWKASIDGCCMYRCESDGIVPVKFNCSNVPQPVCTRAGEISISLADDNSCCPRRMCVCNQSACEAAPLGCKFGEKMVSYFRQDSCCPEYACECDPEQCVLDVPVCREDQALIVTHTEGSCCLAHICMCDVCSDVVPDCASVELLTVDTNSTERCCPVYHCLCEPSRCSVMTCPVGMTVVSTVNPEQCCPSQTCECACEKITWPKCSLGESLQLDRTFLTDPANQCSCKQYQCVRDAVCIDGERGVMRPGQTLMEHTALGVCYTTRCTRTLDPDTGFYRIQASSTNCTAQCQPNQVYVPPKDQSACCGLCKNVSCVQHSDNGSLTLYKPGKSWVSDCMRYDCADTQSGPVLVSYSYSCPPFNETECMKIGGTVVTYMDGCCKTCKEDGKSCQKVTVRMTIRKNDCRSNRPVNIVSCDGKCPSASIYNYNINTYARFCKCCREMGLQRRSVQLYCSGNSSWVSYSIQEPTDCSCQWS